MTTEQTIKMCACGCGKLIVWKPHYRYHGIPNYILGHNGRTKPQTKQIIKFCKCGCGNIIPWKEFYKYKGIPDYILGHNARSNEDPEVIRKRKNEKTVEWRKRNKQRVTDYNKEYHTEHPRYVYTSPEERDAVAQKKGFKNNKEYMDWWAQQQGYKDCNEYSLSRKHATGKCTSMDENPKCSIYLGVHIAERVLSKIFSNVIRMPNNNKGYDFICNKGFKIDVKAACLTRSHGNRNRSGLRWDFRIKKNKTPDHFLLIAFDNRTNLIPLHLWLIKGNEPLHSNGIITNPVNNRENFAIENSITALSRYQMYEIHDKLDKLITVCDSLRS